MASEQSSHFDVPVDVGLQRKQGISWRKSDQQTKKRTYPGVRPIIQSKTSKFGGYQLPVAATQFAFQCQATNHRPAVTDR